MRIAFSILVLAILFSCSEKYPGYTETESGIYKRLKSFGDCSPDLRDAEFFIAEVRVSDLNRSDSLSFTLYNGSLKQRGGYANGFGDTISSALLNELRQLHCGDDASFILPFSEIDSSYFSGYDKSSFGKNELVILDVQVVQTFDKTSWLKFLCNASKLGELTEWEAIEMSFLNDSVFNCEVHGDLFLQKITKTENDSLKQGQEISIEYNTFLLDGTRLDSLTKMQFQFGKPGQLIPGLNYGLSFMRIGETARIYMPSYLAFGEKGSGTGIVPPRTPIYFKVHILDVQESAKITVRR